MSLLCSQVSSAWHKTLFVFCVILQNIAVSTGSVERVANGESTAGDETAVSKEEENKTGFVKFGWVKGVLVRNLKEIEEILKEIEEKHQDLFCNTKVFYEVGGRQTSGMLGCFLKACKGSYYPSGC